MKNKTAPDILHLLLGANIILWLNAANYDLIVDKIPAAIKLGLVVLWFLISIAKKSGFFSKFAFTSYMLLSFYALLLLSSMIGRNKYFQNYGMLFLYALIMIAVFCYYFNYGTKTELKFLLVVFALDIAITTLRTSIALEQNPELVRVLSTGNVHKLEVLGQIPKGIGSYGLCYTLVFFQPALTCLLNKKQVNFFIKLLVYGASLVFLFQAQITIALIMYPTLLIFTYTYGSSKRKITKLKKMLLAIIFILLVITFPSLLEMLINSSEKHLADRLIEIQNFIHSRETGRDITARLRLYQLSFHSFLQSPIWGGFGLASIGGHSTFLDILGTFGLLGLLGYLSLFAPLKIAKKNLNADADQKAVLRATHLCATFLSLINVLLVSEILLTILVIVPLMLKYLADETEEKTQISIGPMGAVTNQ